MCPKDVSGVGALVEEKVGCCVGDGDGPVVVIEYGYESRGKGHNGSWLVCWR
jgi:hypothetical protein